MSLVSLNLRVKDCHGSISVTHKSLKRRTGIDGKKVINLDISDDYMYMDEELIGILKSRVSEYIDISD